MKMISKWMGLVGMVAAMNASGAVSIASGYTLLVAPARYSVVQVLKDVIDRRSGVLVAYQADVSEGSMRLDVWNGERWLPLQPDDVRAMNFVRTPPSRIVLLGGDGLVPAAVKDAVAMLPEVTRLYDLDNASLINDLDPVLGWTAREWRWWAARYNLAVEDEAQSFRDASWYDQPGPLRKPLQGPGAMPGVAPAPIQQRVTYETIELDEPVREERQPVFREPEPVVTPPVSETDASPGANDDDVSEASARGLEDPHLSAPAPMLPRPRLSEPLPMEPATNVDADTAPLK